MREQKLGNTLSFIKLSALSKATEQAKKHRGLLNLHKKHLKKFRDGLIGLQTACNHNLKECLEMPRMKLETAKEILISLNELPIAVRPQYQKEIQSLEEDLVIHDQLEQKWVGLSSQYTNDDFWKLKYIAEDIQKAAHIYLDIVEVYYWGNFKDSELERKLTELELLLKGYCLLFN